MLTTAQLQTLKAAILAETDAGFVQARTLGQTPLMTEFYNQPSTFVVWRTSVTRQEIQDDPGFNFTQVDNLSTGSKYRIWDWMFDNPNKTINATKQNIRDGIAATWTGNAQLLAIQAIVLAVCKRFAKRGEKLYATGAGTTGAPGALVFEGDITDSDIGAALAL